MCGDSSFNLSRLIPSCSHSRKHLLSFSQFIFERINISFVFFFASFDSAAKLSCVDPELHGHLEALKLALAPMSSQLATSPSGCVGATVEPAGASAAPACSTSDLALSWSYVWCSTLLAKQSGSSSEGLLVLWDEVLENLQTHREKVGEGEGEETGRDSLLVNDEAGGTLSKRPSDTDGAMTVDDDGFRPTKSSVMGAVSAAVWADVLAPLVAATLVAQRQPLLAAQDPASAAALLSNGSAIEGEGAQQVVYMSRLVRDPTLQATSEAQCSVVTFAAGPLGLVLGQKENDKVCENKGYRNMGSDAVVSEPTKSSWSDRSALLQLSSHACSQSLSVDSPKLPSRLRCRSPRPPLACSACASSKETKPVGRSCKRKPRAKSRWGMPWWR